MAWHHNICLSSLGQLLSYQDVNVSVNVYLHFACHGPLDVLRFCLTTCGRPSFLLLLMCGIVYLIHSFLHSFLPSPTGGNPFKGH